MKRHYINIILAILILTSSSCATMFNSKRLKLRILTSEPSNFVLDGDTSNYFGTKKIIIVDRDKKPLKVTAYNDSVTKTVNIKSYNSIAYWLNLYPNMHFWTGFIIDTKTKRRYAYPKTVYIDLSKNDSKYLTYKPLAKKYNKYSNILKFSPYKLIDFSNSSIELSYERKTGNSFSTQIMGSYLLPNTFWDIGYDFKPNIKGYRVSIEEKFYFKNSAPLGFYIGLELNYLKNQYRDIWNFGVGNIYSDSTYHDTNYPDTFGIKKQTFNINLKLGYQFIFKRLSLDVYAGFGPRYKDVEHFDRLKPEDEMEMPRHPNESYIKNLNGRYWTVSFPLNVRIGWTF